MKIRTQPDQAPQKATFILFSKTQPPPKQADRICGLEHTAPCLHL